MKIFPLIDFNAAEDSFYTEAVSLSSAYALKHIKHIGEIQSDFIILTDKGIGNINQLSGKRLYLWIMEPRSIHPWVYDFARANFHLFEMIFSHDLKLCDELPNCKWYPWGSYYIPLNQHSLYPKSRNVSIVASSKNYTDGHRLRHDIIARYKQLFDGVKHGDPVEPKILWHKDYRFSVVIENASIPGYFTEKIIDCFRTGTIPIYNGDPLVVNHFNPNGIITFDSINDLGDLLESCNEDLYNSKLDSVVENFRAAERFLFPWRYIVDNYLYELL